LETETFRNPHETTKNQYFAYLWEVCLTEFLYVHDVFQP
jgi:hypothetical protein